MATSIGDPVESYWAYAQTQDLDPSTAVNMVNSTTEAIALARSELEKAIEQGYPAYKLRRDTFEFLRDKANNGWDAAHDAMDWADGHLLSMLANGQEMDPEWIELLDYIDEETSRLPIAIQNAIDLGRPIHGDILKRYDENVPAGNKVKPTVEYAKESLARAIADRDPLNGVDGNGNAVDHRPALMLLFRDDRPAAVTVLQDMLNQNIARTLPLDAAAMSLLSQWDHASALDIAQRKLQQDISRNAPLDAPSFNLLKDSDAAAAAAILEQKIRDAITRGATDTTNILSDVIPPPAIPAAPALPPAPIPVKLLDAINLLENLDGGAKQRMAALYLEEMIARNGPLPAAGHELLTYLAGTNTNAYAALLVKSLRASNTRGVFDEPRITALQAISPASASALTLEFVQLDLARNGRVNIGNVAPSSDALGKLASMDQRAAEQFAKAALADALNRGIRINTGLTVPLPAAPATDTGNFTLTLQKLNTLNPVAAAEWAASFNLLAGTTPMADIKAAFTPDQKASAQSWATVMQKLLGDPGMVDDVTTTQYNLDLDLESALQLVFMGRAQQLEQQLRDQIAAVHAKNELMGKMNDTLGTLNKVQELVVSDAKATEKIKDKTGGKLTAALVTEVNNALKAAGVTPFAGGFSGELTKGELAGAIQQLKAQIDSLGNNQQTEMIRLQSLTTKRNEAYEIITNHMSKLASINEKILSNMR